jgi:hypothetical protein
MIRTLALVLIGLLVIPSPASADVWMKAGYVSLERFTPDPSTVRSLPYGISPDVRRPSTAESGTPAQDR